MGMEHFAIELYLAVRQSWVVERPQEGGSGGKGGYRRSQVGEIWLKYGQVFVIGKHLGLH